MGQASPGPVTQDQGSPKASGILLSYLSKARAGDLGGYPPILPPFPPSLS